MIIRICRIIIILSFLVVGYYGLFFAIEAIKMLLNHDNIIPFTAILVLGGIGIAFIPVSIGCIYLTMTDANFRGET
jgi:hypothetical protein